MWAGRNQKRKYFVIISSLRGVTIISITLSSRTFLSLMSCKIFILACMKPCFFLPEHLFSLKHRVSSARVLTSALRLPWLSLFLPMEQHLNKCIKGCVRVLTKISQSFSSKFFMGKVTMVGFFSTKKLFFLNLARWKMMYFGRVVRWYCFRVCTPYFTVSWLTGEATTGWKSLSHTTYFRPLNFSKAWKNGT